MTSRAAILDRFAEMIDRRVPIVGGGAGTGLSAKWEEAGGIDLIDYCLECGRELRAENLDRVGRSLLTWKIGTQELAQLLQWSRARRRRVRSLSEHRLRGRGEFRCGSRRGRQSIFVEPKQQNALVTSLDFGPLGPALEPLVRNEFRQRRGL